MPDLRLSSLAYGGDAVGRLDGKAVFVPYGASGDQVRVRVERSYRSYLRAQIVQLLQAGPARRQPRCALFGECGGCQWQHIEYAAQVAAKREILANALRRLPVQSLNMLAATQEFHYRRRVRLRWQRSSEEIRLGFYRARSRELVDVPHCPLLRESLLRAANGLREALRAVPKGGGDAALICGRDGRVHLSLSADWGELPSPDQLLRAGVVGGLLTDPRAHRTAFGQTDIELEGHGLKATASGFAQANAAQDAVLRDEVARHAGIGAGESVLELFAGGGNLTTVLAHPDARVLAVESTVEGARLLRENADGLPGNVETRQAKADAVVEELIAARARSVSTVVLDPPREGVKQLASRLLQLGARQIVYVSCDPFTLARDLAVFVQGGFGHLQVTGIDMMPQTYHIEAIASLRRPT